MLRGPKSHDRNAPRDPRVAPGNLEGQPPIAWGRATITMVIIVIALVVLVVVILVIVPLRLLVVGVQW